MSLGLVVLEKKLFTRTCMPTPQSDDIMSADIKICGYCALSQMILLGKRGRVQLQGQMY